METTITTTTAYIWAVSNKSHTVLFKTLEAAQKYLAQFPPEISGGMTIQATAVFD